MSGKKKSDYKAVIRAVLELLPVPPAVRKITIDFEKAVWSVLRELLPNVDIMGCVFHWTQALWRKVCYCVIRFVNLQYRFFNNSLFYKRGSECNIPRTPKSLKEKLFFSLHLFADVISVHKGNMKHARAIEFDYTNLIGML